MSKYSRNRNNNDLFKNHSEDTTKRRFHYSPETIFIYFSFNIIKKNMKIPENIRYIGVKLYI